MNVASLQHPTAPRQAKTDATHLPLESLANNKSLTQAQKVAEASRQFEAILLRQFLAESQKPVITSEFTDNSAAAGIYQDFITSQLADSLSRGDGIGFAKSFQAQLTHPAAEGAQASGQGVPNQPAVTHRLDAWATKTMSETVGQASSLTVHGASLLRVSADKMSAPHLHTGSKKISHT